MIILGTRTQPAKRRIDRTKGVVDLGTMFRLLIGLVALGTGIKLLLLIGQENIYDFVLYDLYRIRRGAVSTMGTSIDTVCGTIAY